MSSLRERVRGPEAAHPCTPPVLTQLVCNEMLEFVGILAGKAQMPESGTRSYPAAHILPAPTRYLP